ncbi:MAG TPA: c-type cytochrome [Anaerolineaceae bacterium]|nr:c-type cytochrome [Anaerolineaceae bacterium]
MRRDSNRLHRFILRLAPAILIALVTGFFLFLQARPAAAQTDPPPDSPAPTANDSGPATESMNPDSWILIPEMPPDATQADYGEQYYRYVCQSCHGDVGRGLTAEWIAQWAPDDQNCWQTKCHAASHPPDGFTIPRYVPPIMGEDALLTYRTAFDLYNYIRNAMPFQAPGTMLEEEYWAVTAYLLRENEMGDLSAPLTPDRAVAMALHPEEPSAGANETNSTPNQMVTPAATPADSSIRPLLNAWPYWGGALVLLAALAFFAWRLLIHRSS